VGLLCARFREADEVESWEAEIFVDDRKAVDPLLVSLDGTSEGRTASDVCPVCNY
jgi:hypothetical protein